MRTYSDGCAAAHALDLVGERWALLIVRELLLGPKRFTDLRNGLPGVAPNVAAERLRSMEAAGIVRRRTLPPPAASKVYELTEWGLELESVMGALGRWGARSPLMDHDAPLSIDSLALALRTLFSPAKAGDFAATLFLRLDNDEFHIHIADGHFRVERGGDGAVDATITADSDTFNEVLWSTRDLEESIEDGVLLVEGDLAVVHRFVDLFPVPEPAALPG